MSEGCPHLTLGSLFLSTCPTSQSYSFAISHLLEPNGQAQRRGPAFAKATAGKLALRPPKRTELFAASDCSEWLDCSRLGVSSEALVERPRVEFEEMVVIVVEVQRPAFSINSAAAFADF